MQSYTSKIAVPFEVYPIEMVCGCVIKSVKDLNTEVAEDGLSDTLSSCTLVTGRVNLSYKEVQALNFGDYVQAHVPRKITNNNEPRTTGCIALYCIPQEMRREAGTSCPLTQVKEYIGTLGTSSRWGQM